MAPELPVPSPHTGAHTHAAARNDKHQKEQIISPCLFRGGEQIRFSRGAELPTHNRGRKRPHEPRCLSPSRSRITFQPIHPDLPRVERKEEDRELREEPDGLLPHSDSKWTQARRAFPHRVRAGTTRRIATRDAGRQHSAARPRPQDFQWGGRHHSSPGLCQVPDAGTTFQPAHTSRTYDNNDNTEDYTTTD